MNKKNKIKKNYFKRTFLVKIAFLIIILILFELLLRLFFPPNFDYNANNGDIISFEKNKSNIYRWVGGILAYEHIPNSSVGNYKINSLGFRDYEYSINKSANTYRIIIIGDSVTFGSTLLLNETFPKIIESNLNSLGKNISFEVWNAGISGYYAIQEIELFKQRIMNYNPDLVIFAFILNDFYGGSWSVLDKNNHRYVISQTYLHKPSLINYKPIDKILYKSKIYESLNILLFHLFPTIEGEYFTLNDDNLISGFSNVKLTTSQNNISLLTVIFPMLESYKNNNYMYKHFRAYNIMNKSNITYFDLYDGINTHNLESLRIKEADTIHYNSLGNKFVGDLITQYIIKEGLIK